MSNTHHHLRGQGRRQQACFRSLRLQDRGMPKCRAAQKREWRREVEEELNPVVCWETAADPLMHQADEVRCGDPTSWSVFKQERYDYTPRGLYYDRYDHLDPYFDDGVLPSYEQTMRQLDEREYESVWDQYDVDPPARTLALAGGL